MNDLSSDFEFYLKLSDTREFLKKILINLDNIYSIDTILMNEIIGDDIPHENILINASLDLLKRIELNNRNVYEREFIDKSLKFFELSIWDNSELIKASINLFGLLFCYNLRIKEIEGVIAEEEAERLLCQFDLDNFDTEWIFKELSEIEPYDVDSVIKILKPKIGK